jgi:hypothetical protein
MYRDEGRFKAQFIEADIMVPGANAQLAALKGKVDVIYIGVILHQWKWDTQFECSKQLVKFSKPSAVVIRHQMGNVNAGDVLFAKQGVTQLRHNPELFGNF